MDTMKENSWIMVTVVILQHIIANRYVNLIRITG